MSRWLRPLILITILACLMVLPASTKAASDFSAQDVIAAVNALRTGSGLAAYQVDAGLMKIAQQHSEHQASINEATHTHSNGQSAGDMGLVENIAMGDLGFLTVDYVISPIWADALHMKTMVGFTSGSMGVGVASNDTNTFVTLDVRVSGAVTSIQSASLGVAQAQAAASSTPAPFVPIVTNTPGADGSIVHIVQSGETLWEIALSYGLKVADILELNGLSAGSNNISVGQKLIIRGPVTATPTLPPAASSTPTLQPTRTPKPPTPTRTPTRFVTATPSPTPTRPPLIKLPPMANSKSLAYGLIGLGVIGLVALLLTSFRK